MANDRDHRDGPQNDAHGSMPPVDRGTGSTQKFAVDKEHQRPLAAKGGNYGIEAVVDDGILRIFRYRSGTVVASGVENVTYTKEEVFGIRTGEPSVRRVGSKQSNRAGQNKSETGTDGVAQHDEISGLIERSSLGTSGARQLRARARPERVALVTAIAALRERVDGGDIGALLELGTKLQEAGQLQDARACFKRLASASLLAVAENLELAGELAAADMWRTRAGTLD